MEEQLKNLPPEQRRSIGAAEFQPPAGIARKTLQEMMGGK